MTAGTALQGGFKPLMITEISDRSTDGRTLPFMCRCEDGNLYYVKGRSAHHRSLVCEWVAGVLAAEVGLNIPQRAIAWAPQSIVQLHTDGRDLGTGLVFASRAVERHSWITYASINKVPQSIRRDILVFDWWIKNADRTLSHSGGNPNLLFDTSTDDLVVIDHNLAFDPEFNSVTFLETHIFQDEWNGLCGDIVEMAHYQQRLKQALDTSWEAAWADVPAEWMFHDDEQTIPIDLEKSQCREVLERCTNGDFWRLA